MGICIYVFVHIVSTVQCNCTVYYVGNITYTVKNLEGIFQYMKRMKQIKVSMERKRVPLWTLYLSDDVPFPSLENSIDLPFPETDFSDEIVDFSWA